MHGKCMAVLGQGISPLEGEEYNNNIIYDVLVCWSGVCYWFRN